MSRSLVIVATGVAMAVIGATWLLGPVALIAGGALVAAAGLLIDEEALDAQPVEPPSER